MNRSRFLSALLALLTSLTVGCSRAPSSGPDTTSAQVREEPLPVQGQESDPDAPSSAAEPVNADAAEPVTESDTAAFRDSKGFFSLRSGRKKTTAEDLSLTLYYDGVELPRAGKVWYLPVSEDFPAENLLKLSAVTGAGPAEGGKLYMDLRLTDIGLEPLLSHNTRPDLFWADGERYADLELCFTTLPVLSVDVSPKKLRRETVDCAFSLWEAKNGALKRTDSPAEIRIRGASSSNMPKTGLKISLKDADGNPNKTSLLGMRKDDDWILYASYSDNTHVRDAVGWHLWQKMTGSAGFSDTEAGALEVRWVEVILGESYYGFCLMMEQMDQKTLGLDAEKNDSLFKCVSWDVPDSASLLRLKAKTEAWSSLERKFPDLEALPAGNESGGWADMAAFVRLCHETSGEEFGAQAEDLLDRDEILEYWLFLNLTMAADNTWKNTYYAVRDGKISAYPWDLDITFGLGWNGEIANNYLWEQPGMDTRTYDFQAGRRLIKYVAGCGDYVRARYETLKDAGIASADALIADAEAQWDLLHKSGAWQRNLDRWPSVSTTDSLDYFKETVRTREAWMEEYLETVP